jgi:hypothetical protein
MLWARQLYYDPIQAAVFLCGGDGVGGFVCSGDHCPLPPLTDRLSSTFFPLCNAVMPLSLIHLEEEFICTFTGVDQTYAGDGFSFLLGFRFEC